MNANVFSISITDIAGWALPAGHDLPAPNFHAQLPSLQRGAVWSAQQVERLWDSLARGFPIGCLILCKPEKRLAAKSFVLQPNGSQRDPDYLLLDGQQRCTGIAVGFLSPWAIDGHAKAEFALWVDLDPPDSTDERDHAFRLLTRSHPWGYQRKNPGDRLSVSGRHQAMTEFEKSARALGHQNLEFRPGHLSLGYAWPYDARAPVPVALVLDIVRKLPVESDHKLVWDAVRQHIITTLGPRLDWIKAPGGVGDRSRFGMGARLHKLLSKPTPYMTRLLTGLRRLVSDDGLRIPAQLLPDEHLRGAASEAGEREDPIVTLFIRINTGGTTPGGEELSYSILKSVMPECREGIEALSRRFMPPPRMVYLLSTLTLANFAQRKDKDTPPAFPDVRRFRRLVRGVDPGVTNFRDSLRMMLKANGEASFAVDAAYRLLVIDPKKPNERPFRLLPLQAARIAQYHEHAFLLLLTWICARNSTKDEWLGLDESEHRRLVGLMCVLSWFHATDTNTATNRLKYLTRLWKRRKVLHHAGILDGLTEPDGMTSGPVLPLPPPKILISAIDRCVTGYGFASYDAKLWKDWDLWNGLQTRLADIPKAIKWYESHVRKQNIGDDKETENHTTERREAGWDGLINRTIYNSELVLYAQRNSLSRWYPEFDPISPSQLQDSEQPWDLDHIHPQNYVQGLWNIPPLIKAWHATIGNLRAWPSEINRSQHDLAPTRKIGVPNAQETENYGLVTAADLRAASAIGNPGDWEGSHPGPNAGAQVNYLRNGSSSEWQPNRQALVRAITARYVALYAGWYEELRVKELFSPAS